MSCSRVHDCPQHMGGLTGPPKVTELLSFVAQLQWTALKAVAGLTPSLAKTNRRKLARWLLRHTLLYPTQHAVIGQIRPKPPPTLLDLAGPRLLRMLPALPTCASCGATIECQHHCWDAHKTCMVSSPAGCGCRPRFWWRSGCPEPASGKLPGPTLAPAPWSAPWQTVGPRCARSGTASAPRLPGQRVQVESLKHEVLD